MHDSERNSLIAYLATQMVRGTLDSKLVMPVLGRLTGGEATIPPAIVLEALAEAGGDDAAALSAILEGSIREELAECHKELASTGIVPSRAAHLFGTIGARIPRGWEDDTPLPRLLDEGILLVDQIGYSASEAATSVLRDRFRVVVARLRRTAGIWHEQSVRAAVDGATALRSIQPMPETSRFALNKMKMTELGRAKAGPGIRPGMGIEEILKMQADSHVAAAAALMDLFKRAETQDVRRAALDVACAWPGKHMALILPSFVKEPWAQVRATLLLTLRFGSQPCRNWGDWSVWLAGAAKEWIAESGECLLICATKPAHASLLWYAGLDGRDEITEYKLHVWCTTLDERTTPASPQPASLISAGAQPASTAAGIAASIAARQAPLMPEAHKEPAADDSSAATPSVALEPDAPGWSSLLRSRVQSFLAENWYMVAGAIMVVVGSSLVAFYTWDKHWLVRYTIMPALLALFTAGLARAGGWVERHGDEFRDTAAILRGIALALLPVNMMAVALLCSDRQVALKHASAPAMAAVYLALCGFAAVRWCRAVHPGLGRTLGGTILALNAMVVLVPLSHVFGVSGGGTFRLVLAAGFHFSFCAAALAAHRISRIMTIDPSMREKRVAWFGIGVASTTAVEALLWSYGFLALSPKPADYAVLTILVGWLLLGVAWRYVAGTDDARKLGATTFAGYALIFLGVLLGMRSQEVRIAALAVAGAAWLHEGLRRRHEAYFWIAFSFMTACTASIGMLDTFPGPWLASLGIGFALLLGIGVLAGLRFNLPDLASAARGSQISVLFITVLTAVLTQWHYRSAPWWTGGVLLVCAGLFALRAFRDDRLRWLHTALVIPAAALPYLGFVDMAARTLRGNTLTCGLALLSALWIATTMAWRHGLVIRARSTVLTIYGGLALAAMAVRVLIEQRTGVPGPWWHTVMDLGGPSFMTAALAATAWYSRSLVPAAMGAVMFAVFFPEMKAEIKLLFPHIGWGTGLGSAISALVCVTACHIVRTIKPLQKLDGGDLFMGTLPYPLVRRDHTLFTFPLLCTAVFLLVKVGTWSLACNISVDGLGVRTCIALGICGIAWTACAVYLRDRSDAPLWTHLGWIYMAACIWFGCRHVVADPAWHVPTLACLALFQMRHLFYRFYLQRRWAWVDRVLTQPMLFVLRYGSHAASIACMAMLWDGEAIGPLWPLISFVVLQMAWHGIATGSMSYGTHLYLLCLSSLVSSRSSGSGWLVSRLTMKEHMTPLLVFVLCSQAVHAAAELRERLYETCRGLLRPILLLSTLTAVGAGCIAVLLVVSGSAATVMHLSMAAASLLVVARANRSMPLAVLAVGVAYVLCARGAVVGRMDGMDVVDSMDVLCEAKRLSLLGAAMAALGLLRRFVPSEVWPMVLGRKPMRAFALTSIGWLYVPAAAISLLSTMLYSLDPTYRWSRADLWVPYLNALSLGTMGIVCALGAALLGMFATLVVANTHAVRLLAGNFLDAHGMQLIHYKMELGAAATLAMLSAMPRRVLTRTFMRSTEIAAMAVGMAMLFMSMTPYLMVLPGIERLASPSLLCIAFATAIVAFYFQRLTCAVCESSDAIWSATPLMFVHALAATMALWCATIAIPVFREPSLAITALLLPLAYQYLRMEETTRPRPTQAAAFRIATVFLALGIIALAMSRPLYAEVLFRRTFVGTTHYHHAAVAMIAVGIVLLRATGCGGFSLWSAVGGLAVIVGSFFAFTRLDHFSPFTDILRASWCAVGLCHAWLAATAWRAPMMTLVARMTRLDDATIARVRLCWRGGLMVLVHSVALYGIGDCDNRTQMIAPLVAAVASTTLHCGIGGGWTMLYYLFGVELFIALHMDFLLPSYLPKRQIVWAVLGLWAVWAGACHIVARRAVRVLPGLVAFVFALVASGHVWYHEPSSAYALLTVLAGWLIAALTPRPNREGETVAGRFFAALLLFVPVWLAFFLQTPEGWPDVPLSHWTWPTVSCLTMLLLVTMGARLFALHIAATYTMIERRTPVLADQCLTWMGRSGRSVHSSALAIVFVILALTMACHYHLAYQTKEAIVIGVLWLVMIRGWLREGGERRSMAPYFLAQLSIMALLALIRRQVMLTTNAWTAEYDIWMSLLASVCLTGFKHAIDARAREVRVPLIIALLALPLATMAWVLVHGLGSTAALIVAGMHSVMFTYLGRDERDAQYRSLAVVSFVAFVLILFWAKLDLRVVHAYVLPVGMGVLGLVQVFRTHLAPALRNGIRFVTVSAMLGSTGYYALMDGRFPLTFLATFGLVCLAVMGIGTLLRIRLHLALGFAGLMVDLCAMVHKVVGTMERSGQMIAIGAMVLGLGIMFVVGAVYSKTHRVQIADRLARWRRALHEWE